ncbi:hypothetical protein BC628DRAFT_96680 [Trametes gibbosa]|nr:hypothetical protein BC628DRAFT_678198 [Trametes gibbosa]KAI0828154.1 hypothetical protein BC628DRAFT_96680 [Trametes gibbosa]
MLAGTSLGLRGILIRMIEEARLRSAGALGGYGASNARARRGGEEGSHAEASGFKGRLMVLACRTCRASYLSAVCWPFGATNPAFGETDRVFRKASAIWKSRTHLVMVECTTQSTIANSLRSQRSPRSSLAWMMGGIALVHLRLASPRSDRVQCQLTTIRVALNPSESQRSYPIRLLTWDWYCLRPIRSDRGRTRFAVQRQWKMLPTPADSTPGIMDTIQVAICSVVHVTRCQHLFFGGLISVAWNRRSRSLSRVMPEASPIARGAAWVLVATDFQFYIPTRDTMFTIDLCGPLASGAAGSLASSCIMDNGHTVALLPLHCQSFNAFPIRPRCIFAIGLRSVLLQTSRRENCIEVASVIPGNTLIDLAVVIVYSGQLFVSAHMGGDGPSFISSEPTHHKFA